MSANMTFQLVTTTLISLLLFGCATENHRSIKPATVESYQTSYTGVRTTLMVGNFQNKSNYMQGLFSNNTNQLGNQAKTILKTHLQQTNRFNLVDRENMQALEQEAKYNGVTQNVTGAKYVVSGSVTEFGRKEVGDKQLFGILGRGKEQIAYAKVSLTVIDVSTTQVIYASQGAGEYSLSNREVIGFGGTAGYDATLNGKVLNFAITEAVNKLVSDLQSGVLKVEQ